MFEKKVMDLSRIIEEHKAMKDRLIELEEIIDIDNRLSWNGSGEPLVKKRQKINVDRALHAAVAAIYLSDNSDYLSALWEVVENLNPKILTLLKKRPSLAFDATICE